MENTMVYFSESELAEFKNVIEQKLEKAKKQFNFYQEQIFDFSDLMGGEQPEWGDENLIMKDIELLNELAQGQIRIIESLEQAKRRIRKGTFGICEVTGNLIAKNRLLADPTLTNSLLETVNFSDQFFDDIFIDFQTEAGPDSDMSYSEEEETEEKFLSLDDIEDEYGYEDTYNF